MLVMSFLMLACCLIAIIARAVRKGPGPRPERGDTYDSHNSSWSERQKSYVEGQAALRLASIVLPIVALLSIFASSITQIQAGHRGVVLRFGAPTGGLMTPGLKFKLSDADKVVSMSVQTEKYEAHASAASKDLQDVTTSVALNWHLDPARAVEVYTTLGVEFIDRIAAPAVQESVKQVTARYNAEDLILRREEVKLAIADSLRSRLDARGIELEALSITNFQFSPTFTAAIEAKVSAQQAVFEALNKLERVKVEAQQREEQARGEANAQIAAAEGQAEAIRIVTEAQRLANESIATSLTPDVLQYILLDRLGQDVKVIIVPAGADFVVPTA